MKTIEIYDGKVSKILDYATNLSQYPYLYIEFDESKSTLPKEGDLYNHLTKEFTTQTIPKLLTNLQFRNLFTLSEKIMLLPDNVSNTIDNYSALTTVEEKEQAKLMLKVILKDLDSTSEIDLNNKQVKDSLYYLVSIGLFSQDRIITILNNVLPS